MATTNDKKPNQSQSDVISSLLSSGDAWVKLLTLALIVFSGASNWFATKDVGQENREDWRRGLNELHQFFANQQTYLQGLQLLSQNNEDTKWIKSMLQQNADAVKSNNTVARSAKEELDAMRDEINKLKAELNKPVGERKF